MQIVKRYHDFSYGHRVVGHENKCKWLHGHNGRVTFYCTADKLDEVGRVIDFSVMKAKLCQWVEDNWDHKFLIWEQDPLRDYLNGQSQEASKDAAKAAKFATLMTTIAQSIVLLPFNPTAENLGAYLLGNVGPRQLAGTGVRLVQVEFEETRKCSAVTTED